MFGPRKIGTLAAEKRFRYQRALVHSAMMTIVCWSRDLTDVVTTFLVPAPILLYQSVGEFDLYRDDLKFTDSYITDGWSQV